MAGFLSWVQINWSSAIGAVGIIGSLFFTAAYFREDSKNRLVSNLLAIDERHRTLWSEAHQRKDLERVFQKGADLAARPMSIAEAEFLDSAILHFETGWRLERIMNRGEMKLLARDAGEFFSLPLPSAVWKETEKYRNQRFVRFVERALSN
jgi:hypothetical protein